MAQQHFRCPNCGMVDLLTYPAALVDDPARWPPICPTPECFDVRMVRAPRPGDFAMDAKEPNAQQVVWRDVYDKNPATGDVERFQRREVVGSVHQMRQIEADSERRFRNGEGEPMRFRMLSTDRSNKDVGSFGREGTIGAQHYDSGNPPVQKSGRVKVTRHGADKPDLPLAPGCGASPLKG